MDDLQKMIDALAEKGYQVNSPEKIEEESKIKTALEENEAMKAKIAQLEKKNSLKYGSDDMRKQAALNRLEDMGIMVNTPMHSTRTGYGDEVTPSAEFVDGIYELLPEYETFLGMLPGKHEGVIGNNAGESHTVPYLGDVGLFQLGSEKTADTVFAQLAPTSALPTDKVVLTSKQLKMSFDITDHLKKFGKIPDAQWEAILKTHVAKAYVRTLEALIINGDTATGATTNINDIAGTPAGTEYFLAANGLRKTAIGTTSPDGDPSLGTIDTTDIFTMIGVLGNIFNEEKCLWITNTSTSLKIASLSNFTDADKRGRVGTIEQTTKFPSLAGVDVVRHEYFPLTNSAGKVDLDTPANNTKGGLLLFRKDCVQWGDSGTLYFKLYDFGAQGVQMEFWTYVAVTVVNQKAGETGYSNVVYGINATV